MISNLHDSIYGNEENLVPKLIYNNYNQKVKVLREITQCLSICDTFSFSIAFISDSGLSSLRQTLLDLESKNIKGRIITSTYLNFNSPKMFEQLLEFKNIDVRVNMNEGFHPKGYIFEKNDEFRVLIGSSNLTQNALSVNQEWNIALTSLINDSLIKQINSEFQEQWNNSIPLTEDWISSYKTVYSKPIINSNNSFVSNKIIPNIMQSQALESLNILRLNKKDRALLISATGTGKTYLAAFDVKAANPTRALFVVHRENIAKAAMKSFKKIIGGDSFGLFTGSNRQTDERFVFATIQSIGKQEHLEKFGCYDFDYIVVDEVHHAGAQLYQNLFKYFKPIFFLGMSATPERNDDFDIYELFDHNIAYEIRLQQAMEYNLLCPFHYFGVSDLVVNGNSIDDKSQFNNLISKDRIDHIIKAINTYKYSGDKVHGLIFVSRKEEAKFLSNEFNQRGYRTIALTGEDSDSTRREYMDRLEMEECPSAIDYIFTVDIFNEGIDVPRINQVVMLRPTQSAIIFVQQLGRGLRKDDTKEYVVVIDIIGNYQNNFMIPIALSGDMTYNKDSLRQFISEKSLMLPGPSTISFDEITKKRIYQSIDSAKFNTLKLITESYKQLKLMLGRIPSLLDFDKYNSIDPLIIFNNKSSGSYYTFLKKYDRDFTIRLNEVEERYLEFVSKKLASGKRIQELEFLSILLEKEHDLLFNLKNNLINKYEINLSENCKTTLVNEFTQNFETGVAKNTYADLPLLEERNTDYIIHPQFSTALQNKEFKLLLAETVEFGIHRFLNNYNIRYLDYDLVLYQKYTYADVCQLLNWTNNVVAQNISGYMYDRKSKTFPIFINYDKSGVHDSINYEDEFINPYHIKAITKAGRTIDSKDVKEIYAAKNNNVSIHLFVRKNKDDETSKEFYYLGVMTPLENPEEFIMKNTNKKAVRITYQLDTPVREDIYNYITDDSLI